MSTISALYKLFIGYQVSKGRILLSFLAAGCIVIFGILIERLVPVSDRAEAFLTVTALLALSLTAPILSLVFASTTFNQLVEDETLVYLWLRPAPRWHLAVASWLASLSVALPVIAIPVAASAAVATSGDITIVFATGLAMSLATVAYTAIFNLLGLLVRQALIWGMMYIFIWELFVAQVGAGAANLSVRSYATSVLAEISDTHLFMLSDRGISTAVIVPLIMAAGALGLTVRRLNTLEVA